MWYNGIQHIISRATQADKRWSFYKKSILLGALREDVCYLPGLQWLPENPSLSHFMHPTRRGGFFRMVPSAADRANEFFQKALTAYRAKDSHTAFLWLGRVTHLLIDMACPVHAKGIAHKNDPFEWAVESMIPELETLPLPTVSEQKTPKDILQIFAEYTQSFPVYQTNVFTKSSTVFSLEWLYNKHQPIEFVEAKNQAKRLIPIAVSLTQELFTLFWKTCQKIDAQSEILSPKNKGDLAQNKTLLHTLFALKLPFSVLLRWLLRLQRFAILHNAKQYQSFLSFIHQCLCLLRSMHANPI